MLPDAGSATRQQSIGADGIGLRTDAQNVDRIVAGLRAGADRDACDRLIVDSRRKGIRAARRADRIQGILQRLEFRAQRLQFGLLAGQGVQLILQLGNGQRRNIDGARDDRLQVG